MNLTADHIAGIVDLFAALTQEELSKALAELAFKRGAEYDEGAFARDIADAVEAYQLVRLDPALVSPDDAVADATDVLVPGPVAFPELPENARDLRHILDIVNRTIDRDAAGEAVVSRFEAEVEEAIEADDTDQQDELVDVSYEIEAWASVDLGDRRQDLLDA